MAYNEKKSRLCFRRCPYTVTRARKKLSQAPPDYSCSLRDPFHAGDSLFQPRAIFTGSQTGDAHKRGCTSDSFIRRELNAHLPLKHVGFFAARGFLISLSPPVLEAVRCLESNISKARDTLRVSRRFMRR